MAATDGPSTKRSKLNNEQAADVANPFSLSSCSDGERRRKYPTNVQSKGLQDLDTNCQLEILQRLQLNDLCTMAEVSLPFKELAQRLFVGKHRTMNLSSMVDPTTNHFSLMQLRRLFYNFGHLIWSLTMNLKHLQDHSGLTKLLALVSKYSLNTLHELIFEEQPNASDSIIGGLDEFLAVQFLGMVSEAHILTILYNL